MLPSAPTAPAAEWGRFHISRDHASRYFVLYDQRGLVTVTVEKTGTQAVQERLEADTRTIGDLQRQVAKLTARFHAQAPPSTGPAYAAAILRRALAPPAAVETASVTRMVKLLKLTFLQEVTLLPSLASGLSSAPLSPILSVKRDGKG